MNSEASEACEVKTAKTVKPAKPAQATAKPAKPTQATAKAKPTKKKREVPREYDIFVKNNWDKTNNFTDNSKKISELWKEKAKEKKESKGSE